MLAQCATVSSYLAKGFSYFYAEHKYALVSVMLWYDIWFASYITTPWWTRRKRQAMYREFGKGASESMTVISSVWSGALTLNAQPSEGWASSMYTAKKSATSLNSRAMLRNSSTLVRKTGHVQLQKLTTSGRFRLLKSKSRQRDLPSTETSWESGAGFPREADFCSSRKMDERMDVNMGQVNSECL